MHKFYIEAHGCSRRLMDGEWINNYMLANGCRRVGHPAQARDIILVTCGLTHPMAEECFLRIAQLQKHAGRLLVYGCLPAMFPDKLKAPINGKLLVTQDICRFDEFFPHFTKRFSDVPDANTVLKVHGNGMTLKAAVGVFLACQRNRIRKWNKLWVSEYTSAWPIHERFRKGLADLYRLRLPVIEGVFGGIGFNPGIASVRVSEGCAGHCSYCGIKRAIGKIQSKPIARICDELKLLAGARRYRLNLCSSDIGAYGMDIQSDFPELVNTILMFDSRFRIEFLQDLNPFWACYYQKQLVDLVGSNRILSILMPVQSGSPRILKLMRRELDLKRFRQVIQDIRKKDPRVRLKTQVIIGFPGETQEDFRDTLTYLDGCRFDQVDAFAYHEVAGTESVALLPKVPYQIVQARLGQLIRALPPFTIKAIGT